MLAVVPVMLQRILADRLPDARDTSSLRIVACSGSALPATVATAWMDRFGENLYNVYGSTEIGQATLATPDDLRSAPGTAGRAIAGTVVEVVDNAGDELPAGETGLIVVGSDAQFTEYTGGGTKERIRGLMSSGDVGYFDAQGRLFVTGRADDMIVSGGENVFPLEIEEVLLAHDDVVDAVVMGVPDAEFGQRLAAFVVVQPGGSIDADEVRALVASRLARHKVPRDVTFVDELARNTTGKTPPRTGARSDGGVSVSVFDEVLAHRSGLLDLDLVVGELAVTVDVDRGDRGLVDDVGLAVAVEVDGGDRGLLDDVGDAVTVDVDDGRGGLDHRVGDAVTIEIDDLGLDGHVDLARVFCFAHCGSQARVEWPLGKSVVIRVAGSEQRWSDDAHGRTNRRGHGARLSTRIRRGLRHENSSRCTSTGSIASTARSIR